MATKTRTKKKAQKPKKPIVQRNKPALRTLPESDPYAADLRWYLQGDWRGDMGVRAIQYHDFIDGTEPATVPDESLLIAAARYRRLRDRWNRVPPEHQAVLQAYYGETRRILPEWGMSIGPVVLLSPVTRALHRESGMAKPLVPWLASLAARKSSVAYVRIFNSAVKRLRDAQDAWVRARR